jgi:hypothetical protein
MRTRGVSESGKSHVARGVIFTPHRNTYGSPFAGLRSGGGGRARRGNPSRQGETCQLSQALIHDSANQGSLQSTNMTLERTISSAQDGVLSGNTFSPRLETVALFKPGLQRFWPVTWTRNVSVGAYRKDTATRTIAAIGGQCGVLEGFGHFKTQQAPMLAPRGQCAGIRLMDHIAIPSPSTQARTYISSAT